MNGPDLKLTKPPIIEAVLDLDCDLPPGLDITTLEAPARDRFRDRYPKFQTRFFQQHRIEQPVGGPARYAAQQGIQAIQFLQEDGKQLVQVRAQGYSFNRLAPYATLDDYLPEIERTWRQFVGFASPVQVRLVRLRYINRIELPLVADGVELNDYLKVGPRLPDEERLVLASFLDQRAAIERETGNQANVILTMQPAENDVLPLIFDIETSRVGILEPDNWESILARVQSLRSLKNRVFGNTLTERCLEMFR